MVFCCVQSCLFSTREMPIIGIQSGHLFVFETSMKLSRDSSSIPLSSRSSDRSFDLTNRRGCVTTGGGHFKSSDLCEIWNMGRRALWCKTEPEGHFCFCFGLKITGRLMRLVLERRRPTPSGCKWMWWRLWMSWNSSGRKFLFRAPAKWVFTGRNRSTVGRRIIMSLTFISGSHSLPADLWRPFCDF